MDNNYTYEYLKKQTEDNLAHFIYQFSEKVINNEASLFIGAGVSRNSGYPGWADLLSECADDLNINSNTIDLYSLAQYLQIMLKRNASSATAELLFHF